MPSTQPYVALLRGINVGGRNIIKMADLRACLDGAGFAEVSTYIQSGNVLFAAAESAPSRLEDKVASALAATFGYSGAVVVLSREQLRAVVEQAPDWMRDESGAVLRDCIFLAAPLSADQALASVSTREGVDHVAAGPGVLYFCRLASRATQSHLSRITAAPIYPQVTIRNWKTTTKLLALLDERAAG